MNKTIIATAIVALCLPLTSSVATDNHWLPDLSRTPGAINPAITQDNIGRTICNHHGWSTKKIRPPARYTNALKRKQLVAWHYQDGNLRSYEEDHLISLEIGGSPTDPKNLWPQAYAGQWGARIKDKLEVRLNRLVCSGTITLHEAQSAISTNWIEAYKRYVLHRPQVARAR